VTDKTLAETIRQRLGECSPAERKVARAVLAEYPSAGLHTVAKLAARAGVSGPTVVRFATRLGFHGFPDLQRALREEQQDTGELTEDPDSPLRPRVVATTDALARTVARIPHYDVEGAVALLADGHRQVYVVGGLLADYLHRLLAAARTGIHRVAEPPGDAAACVADLSGRDVLVVFDFPPYEPVVTALARYAERQHAKVVLFTATGLAPAAAHAEVVLPSDASRRSLAPVMALLEAVAAAVLDELGPDALERLTRAELIAAELAAAHM
jgi:DNA-binding MurR/RpiR family transcriptional regulator